MKRYFIVLPEGHNKAVFQPYADHIAKVSGARPLERYIREAKYLVTPPSGNHCVLWGNLWLEDHKKDSNLIELHLYMENV